MVMCILMRLVDLGDFRMDNDRSYYVYELIDPRTKNTFYVGKGKGDRVRAHVKNALKNYDGVDYTGKDSNGKVEDDVSTKMAVIREIHDQGLEVEALIIRDGLNEQTAYEVEAAFIDKTPGLTNLIRGQGTERGIKIVNFGQKVTHDSFRKSPKNIIDTKLENKPYHKNDNQNKISEINDKCIIIKIHQETIDKENGDVYEAVRKCWRNSISRAKQADYVLAVVEGSVRGVYKPTKWYYPYPIKNCPVCKYNVNGKCEGNRIAFIGVDAEKDVQDKYLHKFVPDFYVRQGPGSFLYVNIEKVS